MCTRTDVIALTDILRGYLQSRSKVAKLAFTHVYVASVGFEGK